MAIACVKGACVRVGHCWGLLLQALDCLVVGLAVQVLLPQLQEQAGLRLPFWMASAVMFGAAPFGAGLLCDSLVAGSGGVGRGGGQGLGRQRAGGERQMRISSASSVGSSAWPDGTG